MLSSDVSFGTFLTFLFTVSAFAWFWVHLRYALFGQQATGQWMAADRMIWLVRLVGIPFGVAVLAEMFFPTGGTVAGFHPISTFIAALIGVVIDWILYGIGVGLNHELRTDVVPEPARLRQAA